MLLQSKQILKLLASRVRTSGIAVSAASSVDVTTDLTTTLSTAGFGGASVAVDPSSSESTSGVIVSGANNVVLVYDGTSKQPIATPAGEEVYGRITEAAGVYTVSFYYLDAGVQTPYTLTATVDIETPYRFKFKDLPTDAIISQKARNVADDPNSAALQYRTETLTASALNTVDDIVLGSGEAITAGSVVFYVNGLAILSGNGISTTSAGVVTVDTNTLGYDVETTDEVTVSYTYSIT